VSNATIISLIANETRQLRADDERARTALAADLYDALRAMIAPLHDEIEALWQRLDQLERTNGTEATQGDQDEGSTADAQDQGREGQEPAEGAPSPSPVSDDVKQALEELANRFEMAGNAVWTGAQVADALRRFAEDRDVPLSNRDDEGR